MLMAAPEQVKICKACRLAIVDGNFEQVAFDTYVHAGPQALFGDRCKAAYELDTAADKVLEDTNTPYEEAREAAFKLWEAKNKILDEVQELRIAILPPMAWTAKYRCPKGHEFVPVPGVYYGNTAWMYHACEQCSKESWPKTTISFTRDEWNEGQRRLEFAATLINLKYFGKRVKCEFCNKEVKMQNDRAFHLQKHSSVAITAEWAKYLTEVTA